MNPRPVLRTLALTFLFGALVGMLEGWGVLGILGLGFDRPASEMLHVGWVYGLLALACLTVAWPLAWLLRLPRHTPAAVAGWAALGLAWMIGNWWLHGEVFRDRSMWRPLPLGLTAASVGAVFLLHWGLRQAERRAPRASLAAVFAALLILPPAMQFGYRQATEPAAVDAGSEERPDITVVIVDTLRADHLGAYGYQRPDGQATSPVIDGLAEQGVVFENAWAQAPWTRPSMASLHSGLYCSAHTVNQVYDMLPEEVTTLAEMASARGYRTGGFSANANVGITYGFGQGFERLWTVGKPRTLASFTRWGELQHQVINKKFNLFLYDGGDQAELVNRETLAWLDELDAADDARPRFTYVHYIDPHTPYQPPPGGFLLDGEPFDVQAAIDDYMKGRGTTREYPFGAYPEPSAELLAEVVRMYDAEIRYVDDQFGKLLDELRTRGMLDADDWLVLTSDHGEEFYEHGRWGHGQSLFEEQVHIPLIVVGPDAPAGTRQAQEVNLLDLHQTVAELVGFEWPAADGGTPAAQEGAMPVSLDGAAASSAKETPSMSLLPLLDGQPHPDLARTLYAERLQGFVELRAVRKNHRKVISLPDHQWSTPEDQQRFMLWFDLRDNPDEIMDLDPAQIHAQGLSDREFPAHADVPADLVELLKRQQGEAMRGAVQGVAASMSAAQKQMLIELGYLDDQGNPIHGAIHGGGDQD